MSESKRKNLRIQGRHSNESEFHSNEKGKDKQKKEKKGRNSHPINNDAENSKINQFANESGDAQTEVFVQYQEKSSYHFPGLEPKKNYEEIKVGIHKLSETKNGISRLVYMPDFLPEEIANEFFKILSDTTKWFDKKIVIKGEEVPQPRLVAWYGPFPYSYSGAVLEPAEMPPKVNEIRERIENILKENCIDVHLNSVLLNLYRNEKDSVAWHSDDELSMGICPTIASVSLGAVRKFEMRPKKHLRMEQKHLEDTEYFVNLEHGSLLIMDGSMQQDWQHRVPKHRHSREARINLTFRTVYSIDESTPEEFKISGRSKNSNLHTSKKENAISKEQMSLQTTYTTPDDAVAESQNFSNISLIESSGKVIEENFIEDHANLSNTKYDSENFSDYSEGVQGENVDQALQMTSSNNKFLQSDFFNERKMNEENNSYNTNEIPNSPDGSKLLDSYINDTGQDTVTPSTYTEERKMSDLNIYAPDFVPRVWPSTCFDGKSLMELVELSLVPNSDVQLLTVLLAKSIENFNTYLFSSRDKEEIRFLDSINDSSLSESNQRRILERLCILIRRASDNPNRDPSRQFRFQSDRFRSDRNNSKTFHHRYRKSNQDQAPRYRRN